MNVMEVEIANMEYDTAYEHTIGDELVYEVFVVARLVSAALFVCARHEKGRVVITYGSSGAPQTLSNVIFWEVNKYISIDSVTVRFAIFSKNAMSF